MNFPHTSITISTLRISLSDEQLSKYSSEHPGDFESAIRLYERNTRLSEAFYTPLQCLEITLRNKLNDRICEVYGADWFQTLSPPLKEDAREVIADAIADLNQQGHAYTSGAIAAELSFGFWVGLLGPRYDATLYRGPLFKAFSENGRHMKRDRVHRRLNMIRRFRNRIAHHEPIFFRDLETIHAEIIEATQWLCPVTAAWSAHHSRALNVLANP